jgi:hypothetical protein
MPGQSMCEGSDKWAETPRGLFWKSEFVKPVNKSPLSFCTDGSVCLAPLVIVVNILQTQGFFCSFVGFSGLSFVAFLQSAHLSYGYHALGPFCGLFPSICGGM